MDNAPILKTDDPQSQEIGTMTWYHVSLLILETVYFFIKVKDQNCPLIMNVKGSKSD